jgi:hypothetical protein
MVLDRLGSWKSLVGDGSAGAGRRMVSSDGLDGTVCVPRARLR